MIEVHINLLAVLVAAVAAMIIGGIWYSPILFGKAWRKLSGIKDMKGAARGYIVNFITLLVMAYILAFFMAYGQAASIPQGLVMGALVWVGFVATIQLGTIIWERKPISLFLINNAYWLVCLLVMGGIIAGWPVS